MNQESQTPEEDPSLLHKVRRTLIGGPRNIKDPSLFHKLALIPILAWIGLGADGLSSASYGPEEAFKALGRHTYLAVFLALATALTVFIISYAYSRIIEYFPSGGGGYIVATHTLGERAGVISGCALLVDYMLTITVSIVSCGDAIFSFFPAQFQEFKVPFEILAIVMLVVLNLRGIKESVTFLAPIFLTFVVTHLFMIGYGIVSHLPQIAPVVHGIRGDFKQGVATLGMGGLALLFLRAFSMGGGTYTGIEAVSNGLQVLREPRVHNGKKTMLYLSTSLAFTAGGHPDLLPPPRRRAGRRQDPQRRPRFDPLPGLGIRAASGPYHDLLGGGAPPRRGPGRVHGRAPGHGQHGRRLLVSAPVRFALGPVHDPERRSAHGWGVHPSPPVRPGQHPDARRHVFHQRLPDLLPIRARHVPVLHQEPAEGERMEEAPAGPPDGPDAVPDHPDRHRPREVPVRRLADLTASRRLSSSSAI